MAALTLQTGVGNGAFAGRVTDIKIADWDAELTDVFVLEFSGANASRPKPFPAYAVWTNISMCEVEGPRYPCAGAPDGDLYACLAAGCCYNENQASSPCYGYPYAEVPLQVQIPVPSDACWSVTDFAGYGRGQACSLNSVLTVNVTDGPTYFL